MNDAQKKKPALRKSKKYLYYYRTEFENAHEYTLENLVKLAHEKLPTAEDRMVDYSELQICSNNFEDTNDGYLVYITASKTDATHTGVPKSKRYEQIDNILYSPPKEVDKMEYDAMILISNNHVLISSSNIRKKICIYLMQLLQKAKLPEITRPFDFLPIANPKTVERINSVGVDKVKFTQSLYQESLEYQRRKSHSLTITQSLKKAISYLLTADNDVNPAQLDMRDLNVNLELRFNTKNKRARLEKSVEGMKALATSLYEDDDEDISSFALILEDSTAVRSKELDIRKEINVATYGDTFDYRQVWDELLNFKRSLEKEGLLEQ